MLVARAPAECETAGTSAYTLARDDGIDLDAPLHVLGCLERNSATVQRAEIERWGARVAATAQAAWWELSRRRAEGGDGEPVRAFPVKSIIQTTPPEATITQVRFEV